MRVSDVLCVGLALVALGCLPAQAQGLMYYLEDPSPNIRLGPGVARLADVDKDGVEDFAVWRRDFTTNTASVVVLSGKDAKSLFTISESTANYSYGWSISECGDIDRDGTSDVVVGAPYMGAGKAFVYSGATGSKLLEWAGVGALDNFGVSVAGAGDIDGDGVPDVVVGAEQYTPSPPPVPPGYAEAFSGATGALLFHWSGTPPAQLFGHVVDGIGDVNGDGHADVAIGGASTGTVDIYSGLDGSLLRNIDAGSWAWSLSASEDLDGDGVHDLVVGSANWGGPSIGRMSAWSGADGSLLSEAFGTQANDFFGAQVDLIGDVDGDGLPDILVSAYSYGINPPGPGFVQVLPGLGGPALLGVWGEPGGSRLGCQYNSLAALGDLDGDGRPEFGAGAEGYVRVHSTTALQPTLYCTAKVNSQGCLPVTSWSGTPSLSGPDDFFLRCDQVVNQMLGVLVWGLKPTATPFLGGTMCASRPWIAAGRAYSGGSTSGNDCSGALSILISQSGMASAGLTPGTTVFAQFLYRDKFLPYGTSAGMSEGVRFGVLP